MKKINDIVDDIPYITEVRKEFYKTILNQKYNEILKVAYKKGNK